MSKVSCGAAVANDERVMLVVREILREVAKACGFSHGEALAPRQDGHCLVQTGASWQRDLGAELFYTYSSDLIFPPNVGVPGRCWKLRQTQMHSDVTVLPPTVFLRAEMALKAGLLVLPPTVFLRAEMALKAGLRGCVAIPIQAKGSSDLIIMLYLTPKPITGQASRLPW
ncbi:hypothetical protein T484DRAFT_1786569 [Baffinella frigidus]|nr:hypothetical protein T484DRAFT_1786569 [Cryptophyta sp. CCMP2293]